MLASIVCVGRDLLRTRTTKGYSPGSLSGRRSGLKLITRWVCSPGSSTVSTRSRRTQSRGTPSSSMKKRSCSSLRLWISSMAWTYTPGVTGWSGPDSSTRYVGCSISMRWVTSTPTGSVGVSSAGRKIRRTSPI